MNPVKSALQSIIRSSGFDIRKISHLGLDALNDIERILGKGRLQTVFDVGAHEGETALEYARRFPAATIHSFEPAPATFAILKTNLGGFANVKLVNAALGENDGTSTLHVNRFSATNSLLPPLTRFNDASTGELLKAEGQVPISVCTLDSYCQQNRINQIDLLKMDVQGFELHLLNGARELLRRRGIALVYSEVSFERFYEGQPLFQQVYQRLADEGFQLVDLYGQTRSECQAVRWCDALFVHPEALGKRSPT